MAGTSHFFIGTYTKNAESRGIYSGTLDSMTGALGPLVLAAETPNPSFVALAPGNRFLYAAGEAAESEVSAFSVNTDRTLTPLNSRPSGGASACHVWVDPSGKRVLAANYRGGSISVFGVEDGGGLGERTAFVQYSGSGPNPKRQEAPHAHAIYTSADGKFVYACDLGTDKVFSYHLGEDGSLSPTDPPSASVPPGAGVRHLAFGPGDRFVYAANELGLSVTVFSRDAETGALKPLQTIPLLPEGEASEGSSAAEIVFHPTLPRLYATTRGANRISVFGVLPDGSLERLQVVPSQVAAPRGFDLDPGGRWAVVAGQADNKIAVLGVDPGTGLLSPTEYSASVGTPVCVLFER